MLLSSVGRSVRCVWDGSVGVMPLTEAEMSWHHRNVRPSRGVQSHRGLSWALER